MMHDFYTECYSIAYRLACQHHLYQEAEDCAIEFSESMFARCSTRREVFLTESHRKAWVYRCAKNWVISYHRRLMRRTVHEADLLEDAHWSSFSVNRETIIVEGEKKIFWDHLANALDQLPEKSKQMWLARHFDCASYLTIAESFHSKPDAVRIKIARTNNLLKQTLTELGFTEIIANDLLADLAPPPLCI